MLQLILIVLVEHTIKNVMQIVIFAVEINNIFFYNTQKNRKKRLLLIAYKTKSLCGKPAGINLIIKTFLQSLYDHYCS